jgi:hypothetical protein
MSLHLWQLGLTWAWTMMKAKVEMQATVLGCNMQRSQSFPVLRELQQVLLAADTQAL